MGVLAVDRPLHEALRSQDGLYTVLLKHPTGALEPSVVGSLTRLLLLDDDPEAVVAAMAAPEAHVVTMTITEGGYSTDKSTGRFRPDDALRADVTAERPRTAFGLLTAALRRRRERGVPRSPSSPATTSRTTARWPARPCSSSPASRTRGPARTSPAGSRPPSPSRTPWSTGSPRSRRMTTAGG